MTEKSNAATESEIPELKPLYPQYDESSHASYVQRLEKALEGNDNKLHNIALSGVYGSGKSSILEKVVKDLEEERPHTTRTISLAPLAAQLKKQDDRKVNSVSDEGDSAPEKPSGAPPKSSNNSSITNLIQKEIIKQLLYGTDPGKIPASHFHRINEIGLGKQLLSSLACGALLLFILDIHKWPYNRIQELLTWLPIPTSITKILAEIVIIGLLLIATFALFHYFDTRIHLAKIDVGTAGITLGENSDSYFDQYLDEIIYIFEKTGIRTVFFEDLDRFQDAQIFDSLRELNQILNNDPKLRHTESTIQKISQRLHFSPSAEEKNSQSSIPIQFVYAIHDAIFSNQYVLADEQVSNKESLSHSFSRAKFFDLIIPVMPFVSASNSYQIALETLEDVLDANDPQMINLLELVADAIPDKRTWINIRNEFIVYREHLFVQSPEGRFTSKLGLDESHLLAFIIYKNCYLDDSVKIHDGKSKLDYFYNNARELAKQKLSNLIDQNHKLEDQISRFTDESNAEKRALELKAKLCHFMALIADTTEDNEDSLRVGLNANNVSDASTPQAWRELTGCEETDQVYVEYDYHWTRITRLIPYSLLKRVIDTSLDIGQWEESQKINLTNKNADLSKTIEDLRSGDWAFILQFEESQTKESQTSLDKDFYALLDGNTSLLYRLISHGWIGQDYMLYSTIYTDEGITRNALNFILHHIDGNNPDYQFKLDDEDSEDALRRIRRKDKAIFHQHRVLNIDLLHYMLSHCDDSETNQDTDQIIEMLSPLDNETSEFVSAYLDRLDDKANSLLDKMASRSQKLLSFLAQRGTTGTDMLCQHLDVAFHHLSREIQYTVDGNLADFLQNHWRSISIFRDSNIAPALVEPIVQILNDGKVRIDSLSELGYKDSSSGLRYPCVEQNLYVFSRGNLETALDTISQSDNNQDGSYSVCNRLPALNMIMHISRTVYANALGHLEKYFDLLTKDEYALDCSSNQNIADDLLHILDDIRQQANEEEDTEKLILTLLNRCSSSARLPLFDDRFGNYTDALMECDAVHFTPTNLQWAFTHDALTEHESSMTTWIQKHDSFEQGDTDDKLDKEKLAEDTINLPPTILKSDKKIQLLQELELDSPIPASSIELDHQDLEHYPEIYAQLLKNGLVADMAESFESLEGQPWPVREAWIKESQKFGDYLGDVKLHPNEACHIVCAEDPQLQRFAGIIMDNFRDYTEGADETELLNASAALIRKGKNIDEATRQDLAEHDDGLDNTRSLLDAEPERQSAIAMFADALEYAVTHGQTENDIVRNMKQIFQKLGDEYLKFINPNSKCINLPNTDENQQIIKTLCNWKPQLIPQIEKIDEKNLIQIRRDQKLWNGFFKQGE
ncbi:hypothetical protein PMO90_06665 [Bifidobacterium pseudocatenulatum]|uniref:YobI family P-loop NTPase n=1 Tax=Bifidobacterium pseudocatenulatum TaxID=28026 RepID=UPI0018976EDA|nr:hypothetical protein [Bifidobacterium pseudocatenulatum]MDB6518337.1 hypothetical protein [Bifidobacterium pseudocatenulatum]MDB6525363.1 hypothetical protein [Bifidobacterium pseudocatenulatum]MDB6527673.1 hypothetical protein [Bifidobacterium pseudocatenulatum]MDB6529355.1 hypothetical protein [Bifidobacterium pseudocatenulatum]MDB6531192.1 hypothetical protein [Bifidobacterium pseudocatenulatum]